MEAYCPMLRSGQPSVLTSFTSSSRSSRQVAALTGRDEPVARRWALQRRLCRI